MIPKSKEKAGSEEQSRILAELKRSNYRDKYLIDINDFEFVKKINSGGFGVINLVRNKKSHKLYAAKTSHTKIKNQHPIFISREIGILIQVQHPTIIKFEGYSFTDLDGQENITFLMDYIEKGSLSDLLDQIYKSLTPHDFDNTKKQIILVGVSLGMAILHLHRVIHRDLKPDNILLDGDYQPLITDFGLSKIYNTSKPNEQSISNCGTIPYMAPEVIEGNSFNIKADVYAFGILMYELVTGTRAYKDIIDKIGLYRLSQKVVKGYRPQFDAPVKNGIKLIIKKCWSKNPDDRPTFSEIFSKLSLSSNDTFLKFQLNDYEPVIFDDSFDDEDEDKEDESLKYCLEDVDINKLFDYVDDLLDKTSRKSQDDLTELKRENQELKSKISKLENKVDKLTKCIKESRVPIKSSETDGGDDSGELKSKVSMLEEQLKQLTKLISSNSSFSNPEKIPDAKPKSPDHSTIDSSSSESALPKIKMPSTSPSKITPKKHIFISAKSSSKLPSIKSPTISDDKKTPPLSPTISDDKTETKKCVRKDIITVDDFNQLSISKQNELISSILHTHKKNYFTNFNNLIQYLMNFDIDKDNKYLEIIADDNTEELKKIDDKSSVYFLSSATELIYENKSFEKTQFNDLIKPFTNAYFELKFISKCFKEFHEVLLSKSKESIESISKESIESKYKDSIESISKESTEPLCIIKIAIFMTGLSKTSYTFTGNKDICSVRIGKPITLINGNDDSKGGSFTGCSSLEYAVISSSVNLIGKEAFKTCTSLTKVTFEAHSSLTSFAESAFYACSSLKKIQIPSSVKSIDRYAFYQCSSLKEVKFEKSSSLTIIGNYAFENCSSLEQIEIPPSVTSICEYAFNNCTSLQVVKIPSSVKSIEVYAFYKCNSLKEVKFEKSSSLTIIGNYAFGLCSSLEQIDIPSSVTKIGEYSFQQCSSLQIISIPSSVKTIGIGAFCICSSVKEISIPSSVTSIGDSAFLQCSSLKTVSVPSSITTICQYTFQQCTSLKTVSIPSSVTSICQYAFYQCSSLKEISIPSSVSSIGQYAFYRCTSLEKASFKKRDQNVSFGTNVFDGCSSLEIIEFPNISVIGKNTFSDCSSLVQVNIPEGVQKIDSSAFRNCTSLVEVTFPSSLRYIYNYAFYGCSYLTEATISSNVSIYSDCFPQQTRIMRK